MAAVKEVLLQHTLNLQALTIAQSTHSARSVCSMGSAGLKISQSIMYAPIMLICCLGECSTAVAALIALISPLPYSADFRPYFTIHDPDFHAMTTPDPASTHTNLPHLLGVTNRYFLKVAGAAHMYTSLYPAPCFCQTACPTMVLARSKPCPLIGAK